MTAAQLRAMTCGQVLACSPVVLCDERGRRFALVERLVTCDRRTDPTGLATPTAVPVLTLVLRPAGADVRTGEAS